MRCRVGDLAVKVGGKNLGLLVDVVEKHDKFANVWRVRVHADASSDLGLIRKGNLACTYDSELRPLRDPGDDAQDETLLWAGLPNREEVEQ